MLFSLFRFQHAVVKKKKIRSEVKSHALDYVETLYGFNSGHSKLIIRKNRKLAEDLKNSSYLYKVQILFTSFTV